MMTLQKTTNSKENLIFEPTVNRLAICWTKYNTTMRQLRKHFYIGGAGGRFVEYLICKYKGLTQQDFPQQNEYNDSIKVKDIGVDIKTH